MRILLVVTMLLAMACGNVGVAPAYRVGCTPSYARMSDETVSEQWYGVHQTIDGAVIGCAEAIESINETEGQKLKELLRQVLSEEGYDLIAKWDTKSFREELAGRVNSLLGRQVATDVFLFNISFSE